MKLRVTGRQGQLARSLAQRVAHHRDIRLTNVARPDFDLADPASVDKALNASACDVVVSAAGYTDVDGAEREPERAFVINRDGAEAVARAAARRGAPVIHVSTDYVFAGDLARSYSENDAAEPRTVYGRSKLAGEYAVAAANPRHVIVRTAWLFSPFGKNFVKTILGLAREHDELPVVADCWGSPTSAFDLADVIIVIARALHASSRDYGVYHLAGAGATHWAGLARRVLATSRMHGGPSARVRDVGRDYFAPVAARPVDTRLDSQKVERVFGYRAVPWQNAADRVTKRILATGT